MIVVGSTVLVGGGQDVVAIDGNTARQLWRQSIDDTVTSIATDGAVICATGSRGGIYAFQF
jgi:outer membrane protein assembly factor BamB